MEEIMYDPLENDEYYAENNDSSPDKRKKCNYKQRYRKQWERDDRLRVWLTQCKIDPNFAYCKACNLKLTTRLAAILKHFKTEKHQKRMEMEGVMLQILYDNEETVGETEASDDLRDVNIGGENFVEVKEPKPKRHRPTGLSYNTKKKHSMETNDWGAIKSEWNTSLSDKHSSSITPAKSFTSFRQAGGTEDEFAVFGRYIGNELRQVQDSFAQQTAKMKINTILFEALTGQYNRPQTQMPEVSQPYEIVVGTICPPTTSAV